jgi:RNA polymerase nonessential primary-like sigma factor
VYTSATWSVASSAAARIPRGSHLRLTPVSCTRRRCTTVASKASILTYAAWWVRHYCKRSVENSVGDIRIPVHAQQKMKKATGKFTPMRADRLDARMPGADDVTMLDTIASNDVLPEAAAAESRRQARIRAAYRKVLETLDERERVIAIERLSRPEPDQTTLLAIGNRFGISRERVRQIELDLKTKLRLRIARLGGRELLAA